MFKELNDLTSEIENHRDAMYTLAESKGQSALKSAVAQLVTEVPDIEAIRWKQYVPNDEKLPFFTFHDLSYLVNGQWMISPDVSHAELNGHNKEKILREFEEVLHNSEYTVQVLFGTDVEVSTNKDGFVIMDYPDHD